ncbi:hypothetical protein BLNAU_17991 [Blattamonas nauphoetae]|uniref:Uncharacterized protein n=1 Tax=Blattamonas nauphoetae TaxID=2049346 RepID=A0ABQ9X642_9EUKA|nr:hypothetical protein BLNAU_17991 [Blattamonas nauphoetae]
MEPICLSPMLCHKSPFELRLEDYYLGRRSAGCGQTHLSQIHSSKLFSRSYQSTLRSMNPGDTPKAQNVTISKVDEFSTIRNVNRILSIPTENGDVELLDMSLLMNHAQSSNTELQTVEQLREILNFFVQTFQDCSQNERKVLLISIGSMQISRKFLDPLLSIVKEFVHDNDDLYHFVHSSGFSARCLAEIQSDPTNRDSLICLCSLSDLSPLVLNESLNDGFISLFDNLFSDLKMLANGTNQNPNLFVLVQKLALIICETLAYHIFQLFADANLNTINTLFDDTVNQIRIAPDSSVNSRCLDFGRRSKDWSTFLGSVKTIIENKQIEPSVREKANSWLAVLVMCALSTDCALSDTALTLLSFCLELTPKQVNALLFHTPPTLTALSSSLDTFDEMKQSDNTNDSEHKKETGDSKDDSPECRKDADVKTEESEPQHQSLCAAIAHSLGQGQLRGQPASFQHASLSVVVQQMLANCAIRTLFRITPNPVSFTFFSPELRERDALTDQVWINDTPPSTFSALITLTRRLIYTISLPHQSEHKKETGDSKDDSPDNATRIVNSLIHLLPFLDIKTAVSLVGTFPSLIARMPMEERSQAILALTAILTSESYRIHPQNFRKVRNCFNTIFMLSPFTIQSEVISHLSQALSFRLESSEGEDRWRYFTQLTSLMRVDKTQRKMMLASAVNEDQALFIINTLSSDNTESEDCEGLEMKPAHVPFHLLPRLFDIGAEAKTGKLGVALWRSLDEHRNKKLFSSICNHPYLRTPNKTFLNWILGRLEEIASILKARPEETFVLKSDDKEANALVIYASLLLDVLRWSSADLTQFIPVLSSFLLSRSLNVLLTVLPVLLEIEKKTASTSTPFLLSSFSIPFVPSFNPKPDIFSNSCPLLTIFAHQFLIFTLYSQLWRNRDRISVKSLQAETRVQLAQTGLNIACSVLDSLQKTEFGHLPQPIRVSATINTNGFPLVTPHDLCNAMELFFTVLPNSLDAEVLPLLAPHLSRLVVLFSCTSPDLITHHQTLQFFTPLIRTITSLPSESQSHPAVSDLLAKLAFVIPRFSNLSSIPIVSLFLKPVNHENEKFYQFGRALRAEGCEDRMDEAIEGESWESLKQFGANCCLTRKALLEIQRRLENAQLMINPFSGPRGGETQGSAFGQFGRALRAEGCEDRMDEAIEGESWESLKPFGANCCLTRKALLEIQRPLENTQLVELFGPNPFSVERQPFGPRGGETQGNAFEPNPFSVERQPFGPRGGETQGNAFGPRGGETQGNAFGPRGGETQGNAFGPRGGETQGNAFEPNPFSVERQPFGPRGGETQGNAFGPRGGETQGNAFGPRGEKYKEMHLDHEEEKHKEMHLDHEEEKHKEMHLDHEEEKHKEVHLANGPDLDNEKEHLANRPD